MKKVIVLGAGMVGGAIAVDLMNNYEVTIVDINRARLDYLNQKYSLEYLSIDLADTSKIKEIIEDYDLVIGAVPGFLGYKTVKSVIEAKKNIVDISFFSEDPFRLDKAAKKNGVTAIVDCGVAPGMSNIILGYHNSIMNVHSFECLVGGLPFKRTLPYQYKAPFSPIDVIEEYTRPAHIVENGKTIIRSALSEIELVNINPVGTLEAFNSDGLRTLLKTMKIKNMKEKTLRYPGHAKLMKILRESGFFSTDELYINGAKVRPLDLTAKLLFEQWKLKNDEPEFTVMQIKIEGTENGYDKKYIYNLFDKYDEQSGVSSMARTTGYTCSAVSRLVLEGQFKQTGIIPPEYIGMQKDCFEKILNDLKQRNIIYNIDEEKK